MTYFLAALVAWYLVGLMAFFDSQRDDDAAPKDKKNDDER